MTFKINEVALQIGDVSIHRVKGRFCTIDHASQVILYHENVSMAKDDLGIHAPDEMLEVGINVLAHKSDENFDYWLIGNSTSSELEKIKELCKELDTEIAWPIPEPLPGAPEPCREAPEPCRANLSPAGSP